MPQRLAARMPQRNIICLVNLPTGAFHKKGTRMKVVIDRNAFLKAVQVAQRGTNSSASLAVLSHVLLAADGGTMTISGTNLDMGIVTRAQAVVEKPGKIAIPAKLLASALGTLPAGNLTLESGKYPNLSITNEITRFNIKGLDASEFPEQAIFDETTALMISCKTLHGMIKRTAFASAKDESRPSLTGTFVEIQEDHISFATADGFRLAIAEGEMVGKAPAPLTALIATKAMQEIALIGGADSNLFGVLIDSKAGIAIFSTTDTDIICRLVDSRFPDYRQILPKTSTTEIVVTLADINRVVSQAAVMARIGTQNAVVFNFTEGEDDGKPGSLVVKALSDADGDTKAELMTDSHTGKPLTIAFNADYILQGLQAMSGEQVTIKMGTAKGPVLITPAGDATLRYIVMPVSLPEVEVKKKTKTVPEAAPVAEIEQPAQLETAVVPSMEVAVVS